MSAVFHCAVYCVKDSVETGLKNLKQSSLMNSAGTFVGDTAMVFASRYGRADVAKLLVEARADVDAQTEPPVVAKLVVEA